jgi:cytidylate kinase-like protein
MPVIAIARELGTRAPEISQRVAGELGAAVLDRRIIDEIARRLRIPTEEAERLDESREGLLDRILSGLARDPVSYGAGDAWTWTPPYPGDPTFDIHRASRRVTEDVIAEAARLGNVVIVGRGAAYLVRDRPAALRVFLRAPVEARRAEVASALGVDAATAARRVRESDANRGAYVREAYHLDWRDPASYDLVIDTSRLDSEAAAEVILAAARRI